MNLDEKGRPRRKWHLSDPCRRCLHSRGIHASRRGHSRGACSQIHCDTGDGPCTGFVEFPPKGIEVLAMYRRLHPGKVVKMPPPSGGRPHLPGGAA